MNESMRAIFQREFEQRMRKVLQSTADGDDAIPALRFGVEGFAEAGLALGLVDAKQLAQWLDTAYLDIHGAGVAQLFDFSAEDCVDAARCRFELPIRMRRAPVVPGGSN